MYNEALLMLSGVFLVGLGLGWIGAAWRFNRRWQAISRRRTAMLAAAQANIRGNS